MQETYNVGIYCRLSREDERTGESVSVENQREMLSRYVLEQGWNLYAAYCDDGVSGTTFDRPGFNQLIADATAGKINLVLCKDLSRLGRDYIETGRFTDIVFPSMGCRFIALNDGVDTIHKNNEMLVILKNVMKNKCRLLVGNTFSPKFRQGYIFSHNQTNIPIEHLNILVALTVYNGTLTDLNMVNQFVNDGPV